MKKIRFLTQLPLWGIVKMKEMKRPPAIVVQLIHILGPRKGEIQEFREGIISIGRDYSSHVQFPSDLTSVSRRHADITREGNQFKLVDHSTNGTYVNGKRVSEAYLKNGDVLEFSQGGPKVSFLTEKKDIGAGTEEVSQAPLKAHPVTPETPKSPEGERQHIPPPVGDTPPPVSSEKVSAPLVIQFGLTLRSFKEVPVTIGKHAKCDFTIDHPAIHDQHARVLFSKNEYFVSDMTGQRSVQVNGKPADSPTPLKTNDELALSPGGPFFLFLGGGRLVEITESGTDSSLGPGEKRIPGKDVTKKKKPGGLLSKYRKYKNT